MVLINEYEQVALGIEFVDIFNENEPGLYWPEIDLPATATDGVVVTIQTFRKRPGATEVPVGETLTVTYPLSLDERTYEPAGIRSYNGIRVAIKSSVAGVLVQKLLGRDGI